VKGRGVFVIIPAYNEAVKLGGVLDKVAAYKGQGIISSVVVVDDGSRDNTAAIALKHGAVLLRHVVSLGKGAALKTGCDFATSRGADTLVVMDGDGQHDSADIPLILKRLRGADMVFTYRKMNHEMPSLFRLGNRFIQFFTGLLYGIKIKDTLSGFRAFKAGVYKKIRWSSSDYSVESEMIANAGKHRLRYKQVPIETVYHDRYKGTTVIDGFRIVARMIWWRLTR